VYEITSDAPLPVPISEDHKEPMIGENTFRLSPRMLSG
jgi:hypothetical protein